jgi:hypothetical protein
MFSPISRGADRLDGGVGADTVGDSGSDTYVVDNANDVIVETGPIPASVRSTQSVDLNLARFDGIERYQVVGSSRSMPPATI